jgi:YHS domain-containing protein
MLVLLAWVMPALAVDEVFVTEAGAIRGYDAVAYHEEQRALPGSADFVAEWNGATWRFASAENRDRFAADPERFAPQYGGYCAYGTSRGYKVSTDPAAFAIVEGKLYLNYNPAVQATWNQDRPGHIATADSNWTTLEHAPREQE